MNEKEPLEASSKFPLLTPSLSVYFSGRSVDEYRMDKIPAITKITPWNIKIVISRPPGELLTIKENIIKIGAKIIAKIPPAVGANQVIKIIITNGIQNNNKSTKSAGNLKPAKPNGTKVTNISSPIDIHRNPL